MPPEGSPSPDDLLEIWLEDARRSLGWFGEFVFRDDRGRPLRPARHHEIWIAVLEAVEAGELKRGLIIAPPGHAKSEWCSKVFPAWYLGKHPDKHLIGASATASLANLFSVAVRDTIEQNPDYQLVFPEARPDRDKGWAEFEWFLWRDDRADKDATYTAAGVDGPVIGRRADGVIIDDPYNEEIANSPTAQKRVKTWFGRTMMSRLKRYAWALVIMTRWVPDDLAQDLISQGWLTVHMPARCPSGAEARIFGKPEDVEAVRSRLTSAGFDQAQELASEELKEAGSPETSVGIRVHLHDDPALWPEEQPEEALEQKRKEVGSAIFEAMFQGNPKALRTGGKFKREWFEIIEAAPAGIRKVRYWDLAATEPKPGKDPDWTVGALVGEKDGVYYICDIKRTRTTPRGVEALIKQTAELDGRAVEIWMEQEPGSSGVNTIDHYAREVLKGYAFRGNKTTGSKEIRANPVSAAAEAGNVKLVRGAWVSDFLDEIEAFPNGPHDDQVDAVSGAFEMLAGSARGAMESGYVEI